MNKETKAIAKLISDWKLNQALIAELIGMPKSTLSAVLQGKPYYEFTDQQLLSIRRIFHCLQQDLQAIVIKGVKSTQTVK